MAATADINVTVLSGRLTRDIEITAMPSGTPVGNLSLAYSRVRKNGHTGEYEEVSNFIDCVLIGSRAEALKKYLTKGTKVCIQGALSYNTWERDGQKRSKHELYVDRIQFMSKQKSYSDEDGYNDDNGGYTDTYDYDLPF